MIDDVPACRNDVRATYHWHSGFFDVGRNKKGAPRGVPFPLEPAPHR